MEFDQRTSLFFLALGALLLTAGCAIPEGGAVFSDRSLDTCGLVDISTEHAYRYVRITNDTNRLLRHGGQEFHRHSFEHTHAGDLAPTNDTFQPFGTSDLASSGTHRHRFLSSSQTPTLTDKADNAVSYLRLGLYVRENFGNCVPKGAIIGFIGESAPEGWHELTGVENLYVQIAPDGERGQVKIFPEEHRHNVAHDHEIVVFESNPNDGSNVQTFNSVPRGRKVTPTKHGHLASEVQQVGGEFSSPVLAALPFVRVAFLVANKELTTIPSGALIPLTKPSEPWGWIRVDLHSVEPISGRFLRIGSLARGPDISGHSLTHAHAYQHETLIVTGAPVGADQREARVGAGPDLADSAHRHQLLVPYEGETEPAFHAPPYVEMHLILKK